MGLLKIKVGQELYAPDKTRQIISDTRNVIPAKAGIQKDVRTAIPRGVLTFICCFLCCIAFSVPPVMAGDTTFVPLKDWREYTDEEHEFLYDRWTNENTEAVAAELREKRTHPDFVDISSDAQVLLMATSLAIVGFIPGDTIHCADLRGITLSQMELPAVNLRLAYIQGAILSDGDWQGAILWGANLQGAYLDYADMHQANLEGSSLQGAVLHHIDLQGTNLGSASLQGADLREANLQGVDLGMASLRGANLWGANLQGADLADAIFENTILYRPRLDSTEGYRDIEWRNCYVGDDLLTYRDLKRIYRNEGMDEIVAEFHYWDNWVKIRQGQLFDSTGHILPSGLFDILPMPKGVEGITRLLFLELTYGYGSRPWRLLWYSLGVIGLFTVVFYILSLFSCAKAGIYITKQGRTRKNRLTWKHPHECFYASVLAFATVGYGALRPKQWLQFFRMKPVDFEVVGWIRIFVGIEAALGIWVLALLVTVLFGR